VGKDGRRRLLISVGPFASSQLAGLAAETACGRGLVPYPLELRHASFKLVCPARLTSLSRNRAALVAPIGLALETDQAECQRQRWRTRRQTGPHPLDSGSFTAPRQALLFADELDSALLPKSGYQWMPKGVQVEVLTPGKNEKHYLAGGWDFRTGMVHYRFGPRKTNQLFRDLLDTLERNYPTGRYDRIFVVVDNYKIHKAQAVGRWLAAPPRFEWLWLPTYCPRANPMERIFGDAHDKVRRNHKRKRLRDLVADVDRHLDRNGPWPYQLSRLYQEPEVTAALQTLRQEKHAA